MPSWDELARVEFSLETSVVLQNQLGNHVDHAIHLAGTERPTVVTKMNLTLSADNRVFDSDIGGMTKPDMSLVLVHYK